MSTDERLRAYELHTLASRATQRGLSSLSDAELLQLLREYCWAVGKLARHQGDKELRSLLNAAALKAHAALHQRPKPARIPLGRSIRRAARSVAVSALVFFGSGLLAATLVLGEPMLAFMLVPRDLLIQIETHAWGSRGSAALDLGMTLFYWANNLRASFLALGLGVLAGVPALGVLAYNGMLLGAVAATAMHQGVADRLLAWVAPHAIPELTALVLCGGIGLELGMSWLRPGWRKRRMALAHCGRELTPLVVLAALLVICAAPLEGFVAPLELPLWADLGIALGWALVLASGAGYALHAAPSRREGLGAEAAAGSTAKAHERAQEGLA